MKTLTLTATNGVAGSIDYDHADWAGAALTGTPVVPAAPTALAAVGPDGHQREADLDRPGRRVTSYAVDRSTDGATWATVGTAVAGSATSWVDPTDAHGGDEVLLPHPGRERRRGLGQLGRGVGHHAGRADRHLPEQPDAHVTATAGYGTAQMDQSISGNPLTLAGTVYAKGIGTHAASTIVYNLAGAYTTFVSTVGIDDEEIGKGAGSVDFQVYGDGVLLFDSGVLTSGQTANLAVSVAGVKQLTLVATNGVAGSIDYDHADWANAQVLA